MTAPERSGEWAQGLLDRRGPTLSVAETTALRMVVELDADLAAALEVIRQAVRELDSEHRPDETVGGRWCVVCGVADGDWPCGSRMITDLLRVVAGS